MGAGLVAPPAALPAAVSPLSPPTHNPLDILSSLPLPQTIIHKVSNTTMMKGSKAIIDSETLMISNTALPFGLAAPGPAAAAAQVPPHPALLPRDGGGGRVRDPRLPARPALPPAAAEQAPGAQDTASKAEEAPFAVSQSLVKLVAKGSMHI